MKGIVNMEKKKEEQTLHQLQASWDECIQPLAISTPLTSEELERIYHNTVTPSFGVRTDIRSVWWHNIFMAVLVNTPLAALSVMALLPLLSAPDGYVMNLTADHEAIASALIQILQAL